MGGLAHPADRIARRAVAFIAVRITEDTDPADDPEALQPINLSASVGPACSVSSVIQTDMVSFRRFWVIS